MGIKRCKLSKKIQLWLLEYFVLEVTARSAADVQGLQDNTTALFYRKVRELIADQQFGDSLNVVGLPRRDGEPDRQAFAIGQSMDFRSKTAP